MSDLNQKLGCQYSVCSPMFNDEYMDITFLINGHIHWAIPLLNGFIA